MEDTTIVLNQPNLILPSITDSLYDFNGDGIGTEVSCFGLFDGKAKQKKNIGGVLNKQSKGTQIGSQI